MMPWMTYGLAAARMTAEAQAVIGLRMLGMMGALPAAPGETARMVSEKHEALAEAQAAFWRAAWSGKAPAAAASAMLAPYGRRTRANAERLSRARP